MKILLGDTCLKSASAAIINNSEVLVNMQSDGEQPHSVMFPKLVDQVMNTAGYEFVELDGIACAYGPGSFTGVRIGLTYLKTLAYILDKPLYLINTLDLLANHLKAQDDILSVPLIEARNREVFTALYRKTDNRFEPVTQYSAMLIDNLVADVKSMCIDNSQLKVALSGDAVDTYYNLFKNTPGIRLVEVRENAKHVDLSVAPLLIDENKNVDPLFATPFYLRESGAVRMRKTDGFRNKKSAT